MADERGQDTMKERPIIFSAESVRAILDGHKTQTRRVIVPQQFDYAIEVFFWWHEQLPQDQCTDDGIYYWHPGGLRYHQKPKYGVPGERLWVRETHGFVWPGEYDVPLRDCKIEYRADLPPGNTNYPGGWPADEARGNLDAPKWRPSIHMSRWASRIMLEIINIRVERLQDISPDDARCEGIEPLITAAEPDCLAPFREFWNRINAKHGYPWANNPWVWCITFRRIAPINMKSGRAGTI